MSNSPFKPKLTPTSLPKAVASLFELNHFDVEEDVKIAGAQVDLIARPKADPFSSPVYLEVTVEYVNNTKYAKDLTKFVVIRERDPSSRCVIISSVGFTADVKERAKESRIETFTFDELFRRFEKFSPYVDSVLKNKSHTALISTYEEPNFFDDKGNQKATEWLNLWRGYSASDARWLLILGEYGTGKTALTKVLQRKWAEDYATDPQQPIPVRIELRNFARQFDAQGLLHHFLDHNGLSHIPIEFMLHLIRSGRIILILDGYDEMAQFLNARERRACLSALAELASDGAKGLLTSRPNYFNESEELNVFEALYKTIEQNRYYVAQSDQNLIDQEKAIDNLVEQYVLERYERRLQDLTPEQTKSLVRRSLAQDRRGQQIVLSILDKVFREERSGERQSLSGKPVIISYLLELVEDLRKQTEEFDFDQLTEWQVYKLIVDRLMLRDVTRTPMNPDTRRGVLQRLAIALSGRSVSVATEETFLEIINSEFSAELRMLSTEDRRARRQELFEDLRSSATLTRADTGRGEDGWNFSHNSLREFLTTERAIFTLINREPMAINFPISQPMRSFVVSMSLERKGEVLTALSELWPQRVNQFQLGPYLSIFWDALITDFAAFGARVAEFSEQLEDSYSLQLSHLQLRDLNFNELATLGVSFRTVNLRHSSLQDCDLSNVDLSYGGFSEAVCDTVSFEGADLRNADFRGALIFECNFTAADVSDADFSNVDSDISILVEDEQGRAVNYLGKHAFGYLAFHGAITARIDPFYIYQHHSRFPIVRKITEKISEQKNSQLRGLTQRGEAQVDPPFARRLIAIFEKSGWVTIDKNELVSVTTDGRPVIQRIAKSDYLPAEVVTELINI